MLGKDHRGGEWQECQSREGRPGSRTGAAGSAQALELSPRLTGGFDEGSGGRVVGHRVCGGWLSRLGVGNGWQVLARDPLMPARSAVDERSNAAILEGQDVATR